MHCFTIVRRKTKSLCGVLDVVQNAFDKFFFNDFLFFSFFLVGTMWNKTEKVMPHSINRRSMKRVSRISHGNLCSCVFYFTFEEEFSYALASRTFFIF